MNDANSKALTLLFARRVSALRAFMRRQAPQLDGEELAQEVYVRMLRVPDLSSIRDPEAYLFTVAANLVREQSIRRRTHAGACDIQDPAVEPYVAVEPEFSEQIDHEVRAGRLREVLAQLPLKCQAAVALHYWRGLSYEEAGQQLGVSPHMVKKYLRRAVAHCRRRMARLG